MSTIMSTINVSGLWRKKRVPRIPSGNNVVAHLSYLFNQSSEVLIGTTGRLGITGADSINIRHQEFHTFTLTKQYQYVQKILIYVNICCKCLCAFNIFLNNIGVYLGKENKQSVEQWNNVYEYLGTLCK